MVEELDATQWETGRSAPSYSHLVFFWMFGAPGVWTAFSFTRLSYSSGNRRWFQFQVV